MGETKRFVGIDVAKVQLAVGYWAKRKELFGVTRLRSSAWPGPVGLHQGPRNRVAWPFHVHDGASRAIRTRL